MTNPVILLGTQSNGETLPVQVDATGRLVAEGLPGPEGPKGEDGAQGPPGDAAFEPYGPDGSVLAIEGGEPVWSTEPISGLPEPGPEGSILTIVNGEPTWAAPAYRACQKWAEITLVNNEPVPGEISAFRGDPPPEPGEIWDEYARSQPTWSTPDENAIAGLVDEGERFTYATFNITADHGKIVVFRVVYRCTCNVVSTAFKVLASCDNSNVVPVVNESNMTVSKGPNYYLAEFSFLTNRPAVGNVKMTFNFPGGIAVSYGADEGVFVQAWETEDTNAYLVRKLRASDLTLDDIKLALNAASNS